MLNLLTYRNTFILVLATIVILLLLYTVPYNFKQGLNAIWVADDSFLTSAGLVAYVLFIHETLKTAAVSIAFRDEDTNQTLLAEDTIQISYKSPLPKFRPTFSANATVKGSGDLIPSGNYLLKVTDSDKLEIVDIKNNEIYGVFTRLIK